MNNKERIKHLRDQKRLTDFPETKEFVIEANR